MAKIWGLLIKKNNFFFLIVILNAINVGPSNKAVGPGKNSVLINIGPTFIPESRVGTYSFNRYHSRFFVPVGHETTYTSHSAYVATETESNGAKIDGSFKPNFM